MYACGVAVKMGPSNPCQVGVPLHAEGNYASVIGPCFVDSTQRMSMQHLTMNGLYISGTLFAMNRTPTISFFSLPLKSA